MGITKANTKKAKTLNIDDDYFLSFRKLNITNSCNSQVGSTQSTILLERVNKYAIQSAARSLLGGRLNICCRATAKKRGPIDIFKTVTDKFYYSGLMSCGSVWVCPVCAVKITELRRAELTHAVDDWCSSGQSVLHLTLSVRHKAHDLLANTLDLLTRAFRVMTNSKTWKRIAKKITLSGRVRSLEVSYGSNGWHPHFHLLLFIGTPLDPSTMCDQEQVLLALWKETCESVGLRTVNKYGLSLEDGSQAASYIIKNPMTSGRRGGHVTPFELLSKHMDGDHNADRLFKEFAAAFSGKRQLIWSKGLRNRFSLRAELTVTKIVLAQSDEDDLFARISTEVWFEVRKNEKRGELLDVCKKGIDALHRYLQQFAPTNHIKQKSNVSLPVDVSGNNKPSVKGKKEETVYCDNYCNNAKVRQVEIIQRCLICESYRKIDTARGCRDP